MQDDFLSAEELAQFQAAVHTGRGWRTTWSSSVLQGQILQGVADTLPNVGDMEEVAELSMAELPIDVGYEPGMLAQGGQGGRPPPLGLAIA